MTLALLSVRDDALTLQEVQNVIKPVLKCWRNRNLPTTALGDLYEHARASRQCCIRCFGQALSAVMTAA